MTDLEVPTVVGADEAVPPSSPERAEGSSPLARRILVVGAVLIAVLAVVSALGGALVGRGVFHGVGLTANLYPWKSDATLPQLLERFPPVFDTIDGATPALIEFRDGIREGDPSLWSPWEVGGKPRGSVPGIAFWTPWVLPWLLLPAWLAPVWQKALELTLAITFTFLFLRRVGLARPAAVLGGVVFAFSGFLVVWTNWPHTSTAAMIPALFWTVERALQERTARSAAPVALVGAWAFLSGFPAVVVFTMMTLVPYAALRVWTDARSPHGSVRPWARAGRSALPLALGGVLAAALAAFALLPWARWMSTVDLGYRDGLGNRSLPLEGLVTLPVGGAFGFDGGPYWGARNIAELNGFVGTGALLLALVAAALLWRLPRRRIAGFFLVASVGWVALVFTDLWPAPLVRELPLLATNSIGRARSVLGFSVAVVAAIGFDALVRKVPVGRRPTERLWIVVVGAVGAGAVVWALVTGAGAAADAGRTAEWRGALVAPLVTTAVIVGAVVVAVVLRRRAVPWALAVLVAVPAAVAFESVSFAREYWPRSDRELFYAETPTHEFLAAELGPDRFASSGNTMWSGTQGAYALRGTTGHTFHPPQWVDVLEVADPETMRTPTHSFLAGDADTVTAPVLDRLGVRYFVSSPEEPVLGEAVPPPPPVGLVDLVAGEPRRIEPPEGARAVVVPVAETRPLLDPEAELVVELHGEDGRPIAEGRRRMFGSLPAGEILVPVPEVTGAVSGSVTLRSDVEGDRAPVAVGADGTLAAGAVVAPGDDGLRLVLADGAVVYERERALPRVRWAATGVVLEDAEERLDALGRPLPADVVILSEPGDHDGSGAAASIELVEDSGDVLRVEVEAGGDGWLVVADSLQHGWVARVDGATAPLVEAEHAGVAVPVPAGRHEVTLRYEPPGRDVGLLASATAWLSVAALALGPPLVARLRRQPV